MSPVRSSSSNASSQRRVVVRIAEELLAKIRSGEIAAGSRLPSVRQLARERQVSPFSAAGIYDTLVASGAVEAHGGLGYFVTRPRSARATLALLPEFPADSVWERRREAQGRNIKVDAGCGWLPADWLHGDGVRTALRAVARKVHLPMEGYGGPLGHPELRAHLSTLLAARGLSARDDQILLTQGASQALDLVVRACLKPGDVAVVEDPGYPPIFELLKHRGVQVLGIPRTENGPDVDSLAALLKRRRVHCLFTNTSCHNPTGTTTDLPTAHRLVELANRHDFIVVEDDIFADLAPEATATLASLDDLKRVIYCSSFSKTISPGLRAGYLTAAPAVVLKLARAKVMTSAGSSELLGQLLLEVLAHGHYRRHLKRLRQRLMAAHAHVAREFKSRGVELAYDPQCGLFVWAKLPSKDSVSKLWRLALDSDVLLAPGELFRPEGSATAYWRFNVAQCDAPELFHFLDRLN
jgi:DNA-binding transcriptional MocR family regulator